MAKYKCQKCGYEGDRLIFLFTDDGYCTASNDDNNEYIGPAPEWVTAGSAEVGYPVGCPNCKAWGIGKFELIDELEQLGCTLSPECGFGVEEGK